MNSGQNSNFNTVWFSTASQRQGCRNSEEATYCNELSDFVVILGVQSAAVNVICELARKNPKNYLSLAPLFFKLMTNSTNNWMLIKIIKLVSTHVGFWYLCCECWDISLTLVYLIIKTLVWSSLSPWASVRKEIVGTFDKSHPQVNNNQFLLLVSELIISWYNDMLICSLNLND